MVLSILSLFQKRTQKQTHKTNLNVYKLIKVQFYWLFFPSLGGHSVNKFLSSFVFLEFCLPVSTLISKRPHRRSTFTFKKVTGFCQHQGWGAAESQTADTLLKVADARYSHAEPHQLKGRVAGSKNTGRRLISQPQREAWCAGQVWRASAQMWSLISRFQRLEPREDRGKGG